MLNFDWLSNGGCDLENVVLYICLPLVCRSRFLSAESFQSLDCSLLASFFNRNGYQGCSLAGKDGRCVWLATLPPSCADCLRILGVSTFWSAQGVSRSVQV